MLIPGGFAKLEDTSSGKIRGSNVLNTVFSKKQINKKLNFWGFYFVYFCVIIVLRGLIEVGKITEY